MKVFLHHKSVFEVSEADTLVLPADGSGPRMEGNIARQFMRLVEVEDFDELFDIPLRFPFTGRAHLSEVNALEGTHFEHLCALGILSHAQGVNHAALLRSALRHMFEQAGPESGERFACPLLRGGWRLKGMETLAIMLSEADRFVTPSLELHIAETQLERYQMIRALIP